MVASKESLLAGLRHPYDLWLEESIRLLVREGYLTYDGNICTFKREKHLDGEAIWRAWEREKKAWMADANIQAQAVLAETMVRALPDILTGKKLATDSMFPNSSNAM